MKKVILCFMLVNLHLTIFSQTISNNFLFKESVFQIEYKKDEIGFIITTKNILSAKKDSVSERVSDFNLEIFLAIIKSQLEDLLGDSVKADKASFELLINKEGGKIFEKIQQKIKFSELEFGVDYYYGLTEDEKKLLATKKSALLDFQEKQHIHKKLSKKKSKELSISTVSNNDSDKTSPIEKDYLNTISELKEDIKVLTRKRKYEVSFIGNANVVTSFKVANQSQLGGGFGLMAHKPNRAEFIGVFTVSQANDTIIGVGSINNEFAQSVLIPGVRRFSLFTTYRLNSLWPLFYDNFFNKIGFLWNVNVTPYNWQIKTGNNQDSIQSKALPVSMDFMFPFHWVSIYEPGKDILISSDLGFTARYIAGDINAERRKAFLGNSKAFYAGLIAGLSIKYNGFRFQFHAPIIFGKQVPGLTNGQAYASISIITKIFSDVNKVLDRN